MATGKFTGKDLHFHLDTQAGVLTDVSAWVYEISNPLPEIELGDVTAAGGVTGYTHIPCLQKGEFTVSGWMDNTTSSLFDVVSNYSTATSTEDRTWVVFPAGTSAGRPTIEGECHIKAIRMDTKVKEPVPILVDLLLQGGITIGVSS